MRKITILVCLLFLVPHAIAIDAEQAKELENEVTLQNDILAEQTRTISFDYLTVNFSWMPPDHYRQRISSLRATPPSTSDTSLAFRFDEYSNNFSYTIQFTSNNKGTRKKITSQTPFPLRNIPSEVNKYTQEHGLIDITPEIERQAEQIIKDEQDTYKAAVKLADWVNTNIEYNLSTLSEEADKESSWVLDNRRGVCTELSNLYISLLRSVGIPSRFVTGIAYTESDLFQDNWGLHGWTEVYIPGNGWVPFDPTYGQYGYVDASHIALDKSKGGQLFNSRYRWKGSGFELQPQPLKLDVESQEVSYKEPLPLEVEFEEERVGLGSYNTLEVTVDNPYDYYVAEQVNVGQTEGLEYLEGREKVALLEPRSSQTIRFPLKVVADQDPSYQYTYPVTVYVGGNQKRRSFTSFVNSPVLEKPKTEEQTENSLFCQTQNKIIQQNTEATITCSYPRDSAVNVCLEESCKEKQTQNQTFTVTYNLTRPGIRTLPIRVEDSISYVTLNVIDTTDAKLTAPKDLTIAYEESKQIEIGLQKRSVSIPKNLTLTIEGPTFTQKYNTKELTRNTTVTPQIHGSDLYPGNNDLQLTATYTNVLNQTFQKQTTTTAQPTTTSLLQKIKLYLNYLRL